MPQPPRCVRRAVGVAVILVALSAAACSSGSSATGTAGSRHLTATSKTIPTFTWAWNSPTTSLDISKDNSVAGPGAIMSLVTQPLQRISSTGTLTPLLVSAVGQPNPATYVYNLRSGVRFSDGHLMTAQDVVWSLRYMMRPAAQTGSALSAFVSSVFATGPLQVTVRLRRPFPPAEGDLAAISHVQEAAFAQAHLSQLGSPGNVPVGTGPYQVSSDTSQAITLTRNPYYQGPKPAVDKLIFTVIPQDTSAQLAMRSGSIQGAAVNDLKTASQWQQISGATLFPSAALTSDFLAMDTSRPPFNDVHLRQAIAYSIDRAGVARAAFGSYATVLQSILPVGEILPVAPSPQAAAAFPGGLPQYTANQAKARAELAQSPYPHGLSITVPYQNISPESELTVLNLQQNLKPIGVTIVPKPETEAQWGESLFQHTMTGLQVITGFTASVPDPSNLLGLGGVVGKINIAPGRMNIANWTTPQIDQAEIQMLSPDPAMRWAATKTILTGVADQAPYVPLFDPDNVYALASGYTFTKAVNIFDFINGDWIFALRATT
jgi:peptide/nickel transport system substrate-binding protein